MPTSCPVAVDVAGFTGPFDLLLTLAARHEVDVHDLAIARITDDYLAVLRTVEVVDLEAATQFLVVAAALVELKAARLLPVDDHDVDESELETRDLLYARLLEYRTYKRAAGWMEQRMELTSALRSRRGGADVDFAHVRPAVAWTAGPADLRRVYERLLSDRPDPTLDLSHVSPVRMTVSEAVDLVTDELARAGGSADLRELTAGCRHSVEVIACFLAVLELYRDERVDVVQAGTLGRLHVTALADDRAVGRRDEAGRVAVEAVGG